MLLRSTGASGTGTARDLEAIAGENGLVGQIVFADLTGAWKLARANTITTTRGYGFLPNGMVTGLTALAINAGQIDAAVFEWDAVTGQTGGLTEGVQYFLSRTTPGNITPIPPSPPGIDFRLIVGKAITAIRMAVEFKDYFDAQAIGQFLVSVNGVEFTAQSPAVSDLGEVAVDDTGLIGVVG